MNAHLDALERPESRVRYVKEVHEADITTYRFVAVKRLATSNTSLSRLPPAIHQVLSARAAVVPSRRYEVLRMRWRCWYSKLILL